jgi:hypothetical protein
LTVASLQTIDAFDAAHPADAGDHARARRVVVVHVHRRQRRQLEERRAGIEQAPHPLARQQLAARHVPLARVLAAAQPTLLGAGLESSTSTRIASACA